MSSGSEILSAIERWCMMLAGVQTATLRNWVGSLKINVMNRVSSNVPGHPEVLLPSKLI